MKDSEPDEQAASPFLMSLLADVALEKYYPELLDRLSEEQRQRIRRGDQAVWADIMRGQPELFREAPFSAMEDLAFDHLLGLNQPRPQPTRTPNK